MEKKMEGFGVDYFFQVDSNKRYLYMKIREVHCNIQCFSTLLGEIGESIITCSYENICMDLSELSTVTSSVFGVCINMVAVARDCNKRIKFRFNGDTIETARLAAFDEMVEVEAV